MVMVTGEAEGALASQHLGDTSPCAKQRFKVLTGHTQGFLTMQNRGNRVWSHHRVMLRCIGCDQGHQDIQAVAFRGVQRHVHETCDLVQGRFIVGFGLDRSDVHHSTSCCGKRCSVTLAIFRHACEQSYHELMHAR